MQDTLNAALSRLADAITRPYWQHAEFLVGALISAFGVYFSVRAFTEARKAKKAATDAGKIVRMQTVTVELAEVSEKLDRVPSDISFDDARDLLAEISRRLRRFTAPYRKEVDYAGTITELKDALAEAKDALDAVRPTDSQGESVAPRAVYNAMESHFSGINNIVADLLGLFEKRSTDRGVETDAI